MVVICVFVFLCFSSTRRAVIASQFGWKTGEYPDGHGEVVQ